VLGIELSVLEDGVFATKIVDHTKKYYTKYFKLAIICFTVEDEVGIFAILSSVLFFSAFPIGCIKKNK
jgi:uncharacterized membrane protein